MLAEVQHFIYEADASGADVKVYTMPTDVPTRTATVTFGNNYYTWNKPQNAKWVCIIAQGGGGSGGAAGANASTGSGGGMGGPSGQYSMAFFPSFMLPDTLYIAVGAGGKLPAPAAGAGSVNGCASFVSIDPLLTTTTACTSILVYSNGGDGVGTQLSAANGSTGAATTAGGGASSVLAAQPRAAAGIWKANTAPSCAGGAGGSNSATDARGESLGVFSGSRMYGCAGPGAGGGGGMGGITTPGAAAAGGTPFSLSQSGTLGGLGTFLIDHANSNLTNINSSANGGNIGVAGGDGQPTVINRFLWMHLGGGGGGGGAGGVSAAAGGRGGDGLLGAGGGGAGGCFNNAPITAPGNGGDGFVVIIAG